MIFTAFTLFFAATVCELKTSLDNLKPSLDTFFKSKKEISVLAEEKATKEEFFRLLKKTNALELKSLAGAITSKEIKGYEKAKSSLLLLEKKITLDPKKLTKDQKLTLTQRAILTFVRTQIERQEKQENKEQAQ